MTNDMMNLRTLVEKTPTPICCARGKTTIRVPIKLTRDLIAVSAAAIRLSSKHVRRTIAWDRRRRIGRTGTCDGRTLRR